MADRPVDRSFKAKTAGEAQSAYDDWAASYERDLCAMGYRIPAMIAAVFTRYVPADAAALCSGVITPGHAPAHSFDELIRVAPHGARIVFSLRSDENQMPEYSAAVQRLTDVGNGPMSFPLTGFSRCKWRARRNSPHSCP